MLEIKVSLALTDQLSVLSVSDNIKELLGFPADDFLSARVSLKDLIHPDDSDISDILFSTDTNNKSGTFNIRIRQANGRIRCVRGYYDKQAGDAERDVTLDLLLQDAKSLKRTLDDAVLMPNFRAIMDNTNDYIYFKDRNHVFTGASQTLVSLCLPAEHWTDLIGQTDYDVFPEEYADMYYRLEKQVFAGMAVAHEIQETLSNDGKKGWVDNRKYPINGENGEIIGLYGIARDITERKQAEDDLKKSEYFFKESQRSASIGSYFADFIAGKWESSEVLDTIFGIDENYNRSIQGWLDIVHPDDRDYMDRYLMESVISSRQPFSMEYRIIRRNDGETRWVNGSGSVEFDSNGNVVSLIGTIQDITDRKQAEERQSQYSAIISSSTDAIISQTLEGVVTSWNPAAEKMFGCTQHEMLGRSMAPLIPPDRHDEETHILDKIRHGENIEHYETIRLRKNGEAFPVSVTISPIIDKSGTIIGASKIARDITERMNAEFKLRESEEKFRTIFEQAIDGIMIADAETSVNIEANGAMCTLLGYAPEELIGLGIEKIHPQSDLPAIRDIFGKQLRGEFSLAKEVPMLRKDGTIFYADVNATRITLGGKQCLVGIFRDITDRKQAERALIISEKQLAESQRMAHIGSWEHNLTTGEVIWSEELFRILGLNPCVDPADINEFFRMIHPDDQPAMKKAIEETVATGKQFKIDYRINLRDGKTKVLLAQAELKHDETGMQNILCGTGQDITDRKETEEKIRQNEIKYHNLFESSTDSLFLIDLNGKIIDANSTAYMSLGYSKEELLSLPLSKLDHPTFASKNPKRFAQIREQGAAVFESAHLRKDGTIMPVEVNTRLIEYEGATVFFGVVRDITERKLAEEESRKNLLFIDTLLENAPIGIRVFDGETGKCILANQTSADIAGGDIESMKSQNFLDLESWHLSGLLDTAKKVMVDGCARTIETNMVTSFGKHVSVAYIVSRIVVAEKQHLLIIGRDITAEKQLEDKNRKIEAQMLHAQKLESLGVLAGGIAHDFNNILLAILGNAELALLRLVPESPAISNLKQIELAAQRAADLAQQMLAYSGKGQFVIEGLNINALITEMNHILEVSISKKAFIRLNLEKQLPLFEGDATQIRQVIMNLVINASEAIGEDDGVITITTGSQDYDHAYLSKIWLYDELKEGTYIYFEIADTGCGMDRKTLEKIFDPFFTTKFTGRGLGMAAVLGIVRGHRGAITVNSEPGMGSSFKVFLPAKHEITKTSIQLPAQAKPPKGSGTVLLVDDEETILSLGREMLEELGYNVFTAENGAVAVEIFKNHKEEIACVILDLIMPRLDGNQTLKELQQIDPHVQVIMSSGYNELEVALKFAGRGLADFIQKPYSLVELGHKLQKVMQVSV